MTEHIDREEFEKRLTRIFDNSIVYTNKEILVALLDGDTDTIAAISTARGLAQTRVDSYLAQWDAAQTQQEKDAIVGSVTTND